jgi:hypothetical protein
MKRSQHLPCGLECVCIDAIIACSFKAAVHIFFLCKLVCLFLHSHWTNHGWDGLILLDLWVCTFELSSWYLDISTVGEMVLSKCLAYQDGHLVLVQNLELWEFP